MLVDGRLDGGLGAADDGSQVAQAGDEGADVVFGEPAEGRLTGLAGVAGERGGALGFDLAGPFGDGLGVGSGVEGCLVAGEPGVAVGDDGVDILRGRSRDGGGGLLGGLHLADGLLEPVRREDGDEPVVDGGQQVRFAEVDVAGVADVAGQGVFLWVSAAVVGLVVAVLALHPASAVPAVQPPAQDVGVSDPLVYLAAAAPGAPGPGHDGLRGLEVPVRDQGLVGDGVGPDPAAGLVPAHPGLIARSDVVDVQEDLVLALLVPDLPAGVAGVGHDGADGGLGPAFAGAVRVAGPVVLGRGGDLVAGESLGDGEQAAPGEVLGEDPLDHPGGFGVGFELVQALAVGGLGRVGVRPGVGEPVAVGRPSAEEPALQRGLGGHGGADPELDPVPLALGQAAEHRHDQVVGLGVRVDGPADLGDPQLDAVVGEHGHDQAVLVAVERPLRLPDHHRVEAPVRVGQVGEQLRGLRAALPRQ